MLTVASLSAGGVIAIIAVVAAAIWILAGLAVATYGANRGFAFWPLLVCSLLGSFLLVLLAVTIAAPILQAQRSAALQQPVAPAA